MSFAHMTEEQRRAAREKSAATRAANAKARREAAPIEEPDIAEPLVLKSEAADDLYDGLLSDKDKAQIAAEQLQKAKDERRATLKKAYAKEMLDAARRDLGTQTVDEIARAYNEEIVRIYIDMPRLRKPTGGEHDPEPIIIDQTVYSSGRYYDVQRAKAVYIHYLMDQARRHVNQVDGRSRTYYHQGSGQMIYQGGTAMGGGSLGTSFDALHKGAS